MNKKMQELVDQAFNPSNLNSDQLECLEILFELINGKIWNIVAACDQSLEPGFSEPYRTIVGNIGELLIGYNITDNKDNQPGNQNE